MNRIKVDNNTIERNVECNIIVDSKKIIINENTTIDIDLLNSNLDLSIYIKPNIEVVLNIVGSNSCGNFKYYIENDSSLIVNKYMVDSSFDISINLNNKFSNVIYNNSLVSNSNNYCNISVYHNSCNTNSKIVNHGYNKSKNSLGFIVNGYIYKDSINCNCNQDNKIINLNNGKSTIKPNLMIDNNMISANHSAFIGGFNENDLFYLKSRGICEEDCKKLLLKSFLIGFINKDEDDRYLNML